MHVPFDALDQDSKIWIYQSTRKLNSEEQISIKNHVESFLEEWTAHGSSLQAGVAIFYDQFIVLGVNEAVSQASGCSIDKSVHFMTELSKHLELGLLERSKIAIQKGPNIQLVEFSEIKEWIKDGKIQADTKVFNNSIVKKSDLEGQWRLPASKSWIKRYFS